MLKLIADIVINNMENTSIIGLNAFFPEFIDV